MFRLLCRSSMWPAMPKTTWCLFSTLIVWTWSSRSLETGAVISTGLCRERVRGVSGWSWFHKASSAHLKDFVSSFSSVVFGSWYDHVNNWWKKKQTYSKIHYMFYEDLIEVFFRLSVSVRQQTFTLLTCDRWFCRIQDEKSTNSAASWVCRHQPRRRRRSQAKCISTRWRKTAWPTSPHCQLWTLKFPPSWEKVTKDVHVYMSVWAGFFKNIYNNRIWPIFLGFCRKSWRLEESLHRGSEWTVWWGLQDKDERSYSPLPHWTLNLVCEWQDVVADFSAAEVCRCSTTRNQPVTWKFFTTLVTGFCIIMLFDILHLLLGPLSMQIFQIQRSINSYCYFVCLFF